MESKKETVENNSSQLELNKNKELGLAGEQQNGDSATKPISAEGGGAGAGAGAKAAEKKPYMLFNAGEIKGKTPIKGLFFDFNYGARVTVPKGDYRVRLLDRDACLTVYDAPASEVMVTSSKKYYVNFRLEVFEKGKIIWAHDYDPKGKKVVIKFPTGILGDVLAWFPYAEEFRKKHQCELYCAMAKNMIEIFKPSYPNIHFIDAEQRPEDVYATYYMGIFFPCDDRVHQPVDFRVVGLHKNAAYILGLEPKEIPAKLLPSKGELKKRTIAEPYVCVAAQSSSQAKYWNNGRGWINVVKYLKSLGYRVLCIDRDDNWGQGSRFNLIPYGSEDFTGMRPLQERIDLIYHADFFIGLSSGLSWLAWDTGTPVVLISGFTLPVNEFYTPYRVQHYHVCNGCWNDTRIVFDHNDFEWCPRNKGTDKQFECSRVITPEHVNHVIDQVMADFQLNPQKKHMRVE